eukprot:TRINITY_DN1110_c0_g1_i2.p2 TRINITY_DN1110_c0_g1~~TRINITY_DN1110_c0_g1_i2.p2  ORF type:complete len:249 (+),score=35.84 TRINITY_DN1110_c0_g1_i2:121-867(+)
MTCGGLLRPSAPRLARRFMSSIRNHKYKVKFPYKEYGADDYLFQVTRDPTYSRRERMSEYSTRVAAQQTRFDQEEVELPYDAPLPTLFPSKVLPRAGNVTLDHALAGAPQKPPLHLNGWDFVPQADPSWHPNGSYKAVSHLGGTRTPPEEMRPPHYRAAEGVAPVHRWALPDLQRPTWQMSGPWHGDHMLPPVEPSLETPRLAADEVARRNALFAPLAAHEVPTKAATGRSASARRGSGGAGGRKGGA